MVKFMKCEILKFIYKESRVSIKGAQTVDLLKICDNMDLLLKELDLLQEEKLIRIGDIARSKGRDDYGRLIIAGDITVTYKGEEYLRSQCSSNKSFR